MKRGARQHQAVNQCHCYANLNPLIERANHPACGGAMDVEFFVGAHIAGGNDVGLLLDREAYVAEKSFIQNGVDLRLIVDGAFRQSRHSGACTGLVGGHATLSLTYANLWADCLHKQSAYDNRQAKVNIPKKTFTLEAAIEHSAQPDRRQNDGQRPQIIVRHRWGPETGKPEGYDAEDAGGQKIALQGRSKLLCGPAAHGSVQD